MNYIPSEEEFQQLRVDEVLLKVAYRHPDLIASQSILEVVALFLERGVCDRFLTRACCENIITRILYKAQTCDNNSTTGTLADAVEPGLG